jgi:mitogen-activated protein kinase kinase kinase 4
MRERLTATIKGVQERCAYKTIAGLDMDEMDKLTFLSRTREILHQGYKFGFEYHKDLNRLFELRSVPQARVAAKETGSALTLANATIEFAKLWMQFVMERCERGRGIRPRWAAQGLEFLMCACDPQNTRHLGEEEFQKLKLEMNKCISHVVGSISEPGSIRKSPRSRKSSPDPTRAKTPTRSPLPSRNNSLAPRVNTQLSLQHDTLRVTSPNGVDYPEFVHKQTSVDGLPVALTLRVPTQKVPSMELRQVRVRDAVNRLDLELEEKLRERNLIGTVKVLNYNDANIIRTRSVKFSWHRGIKIGQGGFGKVYTAVNNTTGELMAMKEIPIQPGENREVKRVAEELKIFEGIKHRNLVKYFGVEIHREELLIFMELCAEGTLESLVELSGGLHEALTRRYTAQILSGVAELHRHGVVHRDIKTANIFMTNNGNCLKLGDFGSAAKLKRDITMPGELRNMVGTQAYMAPEVFTKNKSEGHGRAVDIWSVGCCVIEMASGKVRKFRKLLTGLKCRLMPFQRPWYQFDSNFQIMFKVGMGESPKIPDSLSQEGHDFIDLALQHDPKDRWSAEELLQHCFCKVSSEGS